MTVLKESIKLGYICNKLYVQPGYVKSNINKIIKYIKQKKVIHKISIRNLHSNELENFSDVINAIINTNTIKILRIEYCYCEVQFILPDNYKYIYSLESIKICGKGPSFVEKIEKILANNKLYRELQAAESYQLKYVNFPTNLYVNLKEIIAYILLIFKFVTKIATPIKYKIIILYLLQNIIDKTEYL